MGNTALRSNPPNADIHLSRAGSSWLWAVFAVMLASTLAMIGMSYSRPRGSRLFHHLAIIILTVSTINYFSMASDLGATPIATEFGRRGLQRGATRQIWYSRYISWFIILPLLLLELLLATGLALSDIITIVFMGLVAVVAGLLGALTRSTFKWGYFVIGIGALFYIWHGLLLHTPRTAGLIGHDAKRTFFRGALYLSFLWALYPVAWGLSDGGNVIKTTGEMVFYGVLDLLTQPVFLFWYVWGIGKVGYERFGFHSGKATEAGLAAGAASHMGHHDDGRGIGTHHGGPVGTGATGATGTGTGTGVTGNQTGLGTQGTTGTGMGNNPAHLTGGRDMAGHHGGVAEPTHAKVG